MTIAQTVRRKSPGYQEMRRCVRQIPAPWNIEASKPVFVSGYRKLPPSIRRLALSYRKEPDVFVKTKKSAAGLFLALVALVSPLGFTGYSHASLAANQPGSSSWTIPVAGWFTSQTVPDCPVGAILCTEGELTGLLRTYDFVMWTQVPDPNDPTHLLYTGESTIETRFGPSLFGTDTGEMFVFPDGSGAFFITTVNIQSGTGWLSNAGGQVIAIGVLDFQTGQSNGFYFGSIKP